MKDGAGNVQAVLPPDITVHAGNSYGPWITFGAILLSAVIGAFVALYSIGEQRKIARKRATLDMLAAKKWDADYIVARRSFVGLRDSDAGLKMWADPEHKDSPQAAYVRNTLNDYELISVGIQEGILDETLYKRWFMASFLTDWRASRDYVRAARHRAGSQRIYCEIDWLAERWGEDLSPELPLQGAPQPSRASPSF